MKVMLKEDLEPKQESTSREGTHSMKMKTMKTKQRDKRRANGKNQKGQSINELHMQCNNGHYLRI